MPHIFSSEWLADLAYETPFFLISKEQIELKYIGFQQHFPGADIYYAMKANAEPELLQTLYHLGSGFEVASRHELDMLRPLGVKPESIIYGSSVKPAAHIAEFVRNGVDRFACDSLEEVEKLAAVAPGCRIYVRMSVDEAGSIFKFGEKFGTDPRNVVRILVRARELGLRPYGVSFHVGSQCSNPNAWTQAIRAVGTVMSELSGVGIKLVAINIGGGFPCAYASVSEQVSLSTIAKRTLEAYRALPYHPQMLLEPGRGIAAESSVLVASVIARVKRQERLWLFLDAGVYNGLFEAMAYQGSTRYRVSSLRDSGNVGTTMFALAGPTGDSPDVISREAILPRDVSVGDRVVFHDVGAYSLTNVCPFFNGFPKPPVYFA